MGGHGRMRDLAPVMFGVTECPVELRRGRHPSDDWETRTTPPDDDTFDLLVEGRYSRIGGCVDPAKEAARIVSAEASHRRDRGKPAGRPRKVRETITLDQILERNAHRLAAEARVRAEAEAQQRARLEIREKRRAERIEFWRRKGQRGLIRALVSGGGWAVDREASSTSRTVLRRGERGMIAFTLPFSPADAEELERRYADVFQPRR